MLLPSVEQYSFAIEQKDLATFSFLHDYTFQPSAGDSIHPLCHYAGGSAAIFKATKDRKEYAIRCFLKGEPEMFRRYEHLATYLATKDLSWKTDFEFMDQEIHIDAQRYPLLKMEWIQGMSLPRFIDEIAFNPNRISQLQEKLLVLCESLEQNCIGHGDLNFRHLLVVKENGNFRLKLVDYDSMYISLFEGKKNLGTGSPGFQHPKRLAIHFSETIDRFSFWVFLTGLEAIKAEPGLWTHQQNGPGRDKNLLFTIRDLVNPEQSRLFQRLKQIKSEALQYYVLQLIACCKSSDPGQIEKPALFRKGALPAPEKKPATLLPPPEEKKESRPAAYNRNNLNGEKKSPVILQPSTSKPSSSPEVIQETKVKPVPPREQRNGAAEKEKRAEPSRMEEDEIIEFRADKESIKKGEPIILSWKVKGRSGIHISHVGTITDPIGRKMVFVKKTTDYVLTTGNKTQVVRVKVEPETTPAKSAQAAENEAAGLKPQKNIPRKYLAVGALLLIMVVTAVVALLISNRKDNASSIVAPVTKTNKTAAEKELHFNQTRVTNFLDGLYASYNSRQLSSILNHYSDPVTEYYNSKFISRDSLGIILNDLFITPVFYECHPDFRTLLIEPGTGNCKLLITLQEKLKKDYNSSTESYATTIQYVIDSSFRILSEKNIQ